MMTGGLTLKTMMSLPAESLQAFGKSFTTIDKKKTEAAGKNVLGCEAYLVYRDNLSLQDKNAAKDIDIGTLQVTISELADLTGIVFSEILYDANPLWYYIGEDRDNTVPERYEIKDAGRSKGVRDGWAGHVIHDRDDIVGSSVITVG